ncbi:hypothetical protein F2Q70_00020302 [Brassica cretica]|uniref:Plant thionin family protein n=1 Tax=Brassica cretica TaxID=69181 RepID=A0A8S9HGQ7_BRACR|nr:hypothetical protein F2Q70_00020302 [Brassica cretica]KAF2556344.1 hypothetical protein F2Q68_00013841 [Brassica cretica]
MAIQTSKKIASVLIVVILFTITFSAQVTHSKTIDVGCVKNCIVNQCMKASKKAIPATCDNPCKIICTATGIKSYIIPRGGGRDLVKAFCITFKWFCKN